MVWPSAPLIEFTGIWLARAAEHAPEHRGLDPVVERGAGAVRADEIEVAGIDTGVAERGADRALESSPLGIGRGDVGAVAGAAVAEQPSRAAARRVALAGSS